MVKSSCTGVRGPSQAEIPEARTVKARRADFGGPQGRSRIKEVEAAS